MNKCSDKSMKVKLLNLLDNYGSQTDRQTNPPTNIEVPLPIIRVPICTQVCQTDAT